MARAKTFGGLGGTVPYSKFLKEKQHVSHEWSNPKCVLFSPRQETEAKHVGSALSLYIYTFIDNNKEKHYVYEKYLKIIIGIQ